MYKSREQTLLEMFHLPSVNESYYELACFKHALSTPLTILLSLSEENLDTNNKHASVKHKEAIRAIKQLFASFSLTKRSECEVGKVLADIKALLENNMCRVTVCNLTHASVFLSDVQAYRFKEALTCLIKNALESCQRNRKSILIAYTESEGGVHIHIKDFGSGISWWKKRILFLPFVSFKSRGTGFGLYFARKVIVHELSGKLEILSQPGIGTSVECFIPTHH